MRHEILKTYKLFIGGDFPRTESGRYIQLKDPKGNHIANICRASRKDLRNAVQSARKALGGWASKTAYNRSQILYRIAEIMEGRRPQLLSELVTLGMKPSDAELEVSRAVDLWIYFAGWCDKYQQVFGSVNPVASPHFNFSAPEPTGVVGIIAPDKTPLSGISYLAASAIAGGNTIVMLASEDFPLPAVTFSEIVSTSDVPGGVINILTGLRSELNLQFAGHMDINALVAAAGSSEEMTAMEKESAVNIKRFFNRSALFRKGTGEPGPGVLLDLQEIKTTWHPVEKPVAGVSGY